MVIMISTGASTKTIISTLKKQSDSLEFYYYDDVNSMIKECRLRHLKFDRLVFTDRFLRPNTETSLRMLRDFLAEESDTTEVVLIAKKSNPGEDVELFSTYFDAPLFSVALVERPTPVFLLDVMTSPISDVRARFWLLDKDSAVGNGKKSENDEERDTSENIGENSENQPTDSKRNFEEDAGSNEPESTVNSGSFVPNENLENEDDAELSDVSSHGSTPVGVPEEGGGDFDDLSLGEFGSSHTDTDFFDEEDEEELRKASGVEEKEDVEEEKPTEVAEVREERPVERLEERPKYEEPKREEPKQEEQRREEPKKPVYSARKKPCVITVVTGINGSGCSQHTVDLAVKAAMSGKSVLVVDVDNGTHGVLSFMNSSEFYARGCNNHKIYSEDGVDVISNGYEGTMSRDELSRVLSERMLSRYDAMFLDCPVEFLGVVESVAEGKDLKYVLCVNKDLSKFLETEYEMHTHVSLHQRLEIAEKCTLRTEDGFKLSPADKKDLESRAYFVAGKWFDK